MYRATKSNTVGGSTRRLGGMRRLSAPLFPLSPLLSCSPALTVHPGSAPRLRRASADCAPSAPPSPWACSMHACMHAVSSVECAVAPECPASRDRAYVRAIAIAASPAAQRSSGPAPMPEPVPVPVPRVPEDAARAACAPAAGIRGQLPQAAGPARRRVGIAARRCRCAARRCLSWRGQRATGNGRARLQPRSEQRVPALRPGHRARSVTGRTTVPPSSFCRTATSDGLCAQARTWRPLRPCAGATARAQGGRYAGTRDCCMLHPSSAARLGARSADRRAGARDDVEAPAPCPLSHVPEIQRLSHDETAEATCSICGGRVHVTWGGIASYNSRRRGAARSGGGGGARRTRRCTLLRPRRRAS